MSLSPAQILAVQSALTSHIEAVPTIDFAVPSPLAFENKAGFFNVLSPKMTRDEIETTLIRAAWLNYLTFETDGANHPLYTIVFELTVTHEYKAARVDKTDSFKTRLLRSNQEHLEAVFGLIGEFEGGIKITGFENEFDFLKILGLLQQDFTRLGQLDYITGVGGFQTKLQCRVQARNKC